MTFTIPESYSGKTLKEFLYGELHISRATLTKLKKLPMGITLNGNHATVRAFISVGDTLELQIEDRADEENEYVLPIGVLPQIVYEDDSVMVLNKPYGMPTHTSLDHTEGCLANAVCAHFKALGQSFVFRAVNRLDSDTTGIVLVAKNRYYACQLSRSLANGEFQKSYIAVLDGVPKANGNITGYIAREKESIIKRCMVSPDTENSEYSETRFEILDSSSDSSVVLAKPVTGRTHQLRLHFSSVGAPITGDFLYGKESPEISRQALHAYSLSFPSPLTGEMLTVKAPVPDDILTLINSRSLSIPKEFYEE